MKINNKTNIVVLLSALLIGTFLTHNQDYQAASALSPMPANVNVTDRTGVELASYYAGINGTRGDALLAALNTIIDDHNEYNYESPVHRTIYKIIDRNWDLSPLTPTELESFDYAADDATTYIRKFYADYNDDISRADVFKAVGASRVSFDKEHLWAQSLGEFGRTNGAGSDFHTLVPSDVIANQQLHSNYNFATPTLSIESYNNDKGTFAGINGNITGFGQKVMEPLDQYKGDIARAMFYMPARYYTYEDPTHPKLTLVNGSPAAVVASPTQPGLAGDLATLLAWHELDPVDEYEIHRNNLIYNNYQANRNPFIDYPELARIAYDTSYSGPDANVTSTSACTIDSCTYYNQSEADLSYISITQPASKIDYYIGANLNTSGLEVTAHYSDASSAIVTNFSFVIEGETGATLTTSGSKVVTITYTEGGITKSTQYMIYVATSALLSAVPVVTSLPLGEDYVDQDLSATLNYTTINGSFSDPIPLIDLTIGTPDTMKLGIQPVSVTYLNYATSFNLTITNTGATVGEVVVPSDLFFSEYIEGSSNNKAIEIYNGTGFTVDLSTYKVKLYSNGATTANSTLSLTGSLSDGDVFVIYNSSASSAITSVGDLSSGVANFNGDDVVTLENNTLVIDTIGDIPQLSVFASDVTLVRNGNIASGNLTYTPSEWSSYTIDTFTYLGQHTTSWIASGISAEEQAFAYGQYFIDVTGPYCAAGTALDIPWSTLKQEYLAMVGDAKDAFFVSTDPIIVDARARYSLLIDRYSGFSGDNFMVDSEGTPLITYTKNPVTSSSHENFMFVLFIVLALTSLGGYYVYRHKKSEL